MKPATLLIATLLLPRIALADPPARALGAAAFDAYTSGKTLSFGQNGVIWGTEHYMPGHQVQWAFTGQPCEYGQWFEQDGAICFVYEGNPDMSCWYFYLGSQGLVAQSQGSAGAPSHAVEALEPMACTGPQVGA